MVKSMEVAKPIEQNEDVVCKLDVEQTKKNLVKLNQQKEELDKRIRGTMFALLREIDCMTDNRFWQFVEELKKYVEKYPSKKEAIDYFVHNTIFGWGCLGATPDEVLSFVKTYEQKCNALYRPLFDVITGYGDDGFGDIIDSFPLFGRKRYEKALKGEIEGTSEYQYQGENYIRMTLEEKVMEKYARAVEIKEN